MRIEEVSLLSKTIGYLGGINSITFLRLHEEEEEEEGSGITIFHISMVATAKDEEISLPKCASGTTLSTLAFASSSLFVDDAFKQIYYVPDTDKSDRER